MFTGSLDIFLKGGMKPVADQLVSLLSGIHFRKLALRWFQRGDRLLTLSNLSMLLVTLLRESSIR